MAYDPQLINVMAIILHTDQTSTIPICDEILPHLYLGDYVAGNTESITQTMKLIINISNQLPLKTSVETININIEDDPNENISNFITICEYVHDKIIKNEKVLVYCMNSVSRSVAFLILYIIRYNNMNYNNALELLKSKRSQYSQPNRGFIKQLIKLERTLNKN